jgi:hypothetical protein
LRGSTERRARGPGRNRRHCAGGVISSRQANGDSEKRGGEVRNARHRAACMRPPLIRSRGTAFRTPSGVGAMCHHRFGHEEFPGGVRE